MKWRLYVFIALVGVVIALGWSEFYAAAPISGQVVDAQTNEPLPGVNIVVLWYIMTGSHDRSEGLIEVKEAVTDAQGRYRIEGWGPVRNSFLGAMRASQPEMIVFHPQYYPRFLSNTDPNEIPPIGWAPEIVAMSFYWDGKVIALEKATDKRRLSSEIHGLSVVAHFLYFPIDCAWVKAVRFLKSVDKLRERVVAEESFNPILFATLDNVRRSGNCGDVSAILGEAK